MGCSCSFQTEVKLVPINKQMFIIDALIGEGGFGKVYSTRFEKNDLWYAVKEIKKAELMKHKTGIAMITGEVNALKRVNHSHIASLHFAFQDSTCFYLALTLKTGGDLRHRLKEKLKFSQKDVAYYVACISSALDHIHHQNIIHRDIKPENIILDKFGVPYLTDFGVAHVHNGPGPLFTELASGTKQYLAPEVFTKSHVHGPEADYWSLGVVAYELLHGIRPFPKHVPIYYITYLEKRVIPRKPKDGERKQLSCVAKTPSSPNTVSEACTHSASDSPSSSFGTNGSPSLMQMHCSGSAPDSPKKPIPGMFPAIHRTSSTDGFSPTDGNSFCSSVNYTPAQTLSSSVIFNHKLSISGGIASASRGSGDSSCGDFAELSSEFNTRERSTSLGFGPLSPPRMRNLSFDDDPHRQDPKLLLLANKSFSKSCNGRSTGNMLPNLSPKRSKTPPRPIYKIPEGSHSSYRPDRELSSGGVAMSGDCADGNECPPKKKQQEGSLVMSTEVDLAGRNCKVQPAVQPPVNPLMIGDHWMIDQTVSPKYILKIPETMPCGEIISQNCIDALLGLFEVRPSHRLGARNMDALRNHAWLKEHGVDDWLVGRPPNDYIPGFIPGSAFAKQRNDEYKKNCMDGFFESSDCSVHLTDEQEASFQKLNHICPDYAHLFPNAKSLASELVLEKRVSSGAQQRDHHCFVKV